MDVAVAVASVSSEVIIFKAWHSCRGLQRYYETLSCQTAVLPVSELF